jgi:cytochrome oxidase Cu insertion factor (SCO1/SenC/PrrC family)
MSEKTAQREAGRRPLWILIALCIAPIAASYIAYYWWPPSEHVNYGELLEPQPRPDVELKTLEGKPFRPSELKGQWVLTVIDSGACDAWCQKKLIYIRQVRLAQGKDAERIDRVWLITDDVTPERSLMLGHEGLRMLRAGGSPLLGAFPAMRSLADPIYVVDPLGNLMMRYPRDADPRRMLKDVARLLRHSKWR